MKATTIRDMDGSYFLIGLPLPPTENHAFPDGAHGKRISLSRRNYAKELEAWRYSNINAVKNMRVEIQQWLKDGFLLRVDRFFFFRPGRLIAKHKRSVMKLDASNRIKTLDDCLMTMLEVDDSAIFRGTEEKSENSEGEYSIVRIAPYRHGCLERLPKSLRPQGCPKGDERGSLMVSLKPKETISFDSGETEVTVAKVSRGQVKLHIKAPLTKAIRRNTQEA